MGRVGGERQTSKSRCQTRLEGIVSKTQWLQFPPKTGRKCKKGSRQIVISAAWTGLLVCILQFEIASCRAEQHSNPPPSPLLESFFTDGIQVVAGVSFVLPPPLLSDAHTPAAKREILDILSARHGWQRFSRPSVMAPVHVELSYIQDASGKRVGHHVYSAFIVHASMRTLRDQELMVSLFGAYGDDEGQQIGFQPERPDSELLSQVGIDVPDETSVRYSSIYLPLLNRVALRGTARIEKEESDSSVTIAWYFDPRFTFEDWESLEDSKQRFANHYMKLERDELGRSVDSPPVPYLGCGGYLSVRETGQQPDQLFIESRLVLHEPAEWFAGSNFLRSKFPTVLQESAQSFRRRVMKANQ